MSEYRDDGWPLCPECGEDELADLASTYARADGILFCYQCCWRGTVPLAPEIDPATGRPHGRGSCDFGW